MNYGMYVAASGMHTNLYRLDVIANNLANVNTTGFKPDVTSFRWRNAERVESRLTNVPPKRLLEQLGGGVHLNPNVTVFENGKLDETGNPLDVAIDGKGFFRFSTGSGEGNERLRLSRDGRFVVNKQGFLVHAASGMRVLDERDHPIQLDQTQRVRILPDGSIEQGGATVAHLGVADVPDLKILQKMGDNTFKIPTNAQGSLKQADSIIKQGWIEGSAVNAVGQMLELSAATGAIGAAVRMIQLHDQLLNTAINRFGRVT